MSDATSPTGQTSDTTNPGGELVELGVRYLEGHLTKSQCERFNALLAEDAGNREAFGNLCACAYLLGSAFDGDAAEDVPAPLEEPDGSPIRGGYVTGFLGSGWNATVGYFSQPGQLVRLAYLFAAVLCGLGLWAGSLISFAPTSQVTRRFSPPPAAESKATIVATITKSVGCDWADRGVTHEGIGIPLGSCLFVPAGQLEIRYNIGVKVVIQGPAVFVAEAPNSGLLRSGKVLVQVEPGERDARAKRWETCLKAVRPGSTGTRTDYLPAELVDNPFFCLRFSNDGAHFYTIMSDRGAEFASSTSADGLLAGYVLKGPVWFPNSEYEFSPPTLLQVGSSVTAGIDAKGVSRVAIGKEKPSAAFLRGLLEGKPSDAVSNREPHRGS